MKGYLVDPSVQAGEPDPTPLWVHIAVVLATLLIGYLMVNYIGWQQRITRCEILDCPEGATCVRDGEDWACEMPPVSVEGP